MTPLGLLTLTLVAPAAAPTWQRGDEYVYAGTVAEAVDRPANRFRREHALTVRVFVLERRETWADVAVLTLLRRTDDAVAGAAGTVTAPTANRTPAPPLTRLDLVRVHQDGTAHQLLPTGPAPLALGADTPTRVLPAVPLDSFAAFEFGMFPPRPPADAKPWTRASPDPAAPAEAWRVEAAEFVNAEQCAKLTMTQLAAAWERTDLVWASTRDGTARRVQRSILRRDGVSPLPTTRIELSYDLTGRDRAIGGRYDRYRGEIELAYVRAAELNQLAPDAARLGPRPFVARLEQVDKYLRDTEPGTPYREAVLSVRRRLDAARRGDALPVVVPAAAPAVRPPVAPEPGQPAPDCTAGEFRLSRHRGSPVVLVFYKPGSETASHALVVAEALHRTFGGRAVVAPLAVFADPIAGERDRLKLTVPVHDGTAAESAYGIETVPRFVVIDAAGVVRWQFHGVGGETGFLVRQELEKLLPPPAGATGTPGTGNPTGPARP